MPRSSRGAAVLTALALGVTGACRPSPPEWKSSLALADFVAHQSHNLSTELISPADGVGLDNVGSGWRLRHDEGGAPVAEMRRQLGRLRVFSPSADLESVELELGLSPATESGPVRVNVRLNRQTLGDLEVSEDWSANRLEVPPGRARPGLNVLDVWHRERSRTQPSVRLRRLHVFSRSGRPLWSSRPHRIRTRSGRTGAPAEPVVEMPTASVLDLVLRVPEDARLSGRFGVEPAPGHRFAHVEISIRLLDEEGEEHVLLEERAGGAVTGREVDVDLVAWSGELARLRWEVTGPSPALVRWHETRILSTEAGLEPPAAPITREVPERSGRLGRPEVFVILLDAARADALSPFGGPHATPAIERLAADGTIFRQAVSSSSWTLPSVSGMLTGLHAEVLGVGAWQDPLPYAVPTLPELMTAADYRTVLFSQHPLYTIEESLRRGFKRFRALGGDKTAALPRRGELMARRRRTFALIHLLPPHTPYAPPAPYRGRYTAGYAGDMSVTAENLNRFQPSDPEVPSETDLGYVRDRYLENVAFADSLVDRILKSLERHERYADALVILTSDHGEALLEHGHFLHSQDVYREVLHVPLVIKWPRSLTGFRSVVDEPVSLLDLAPTLVDGLDLEGAEDGFQGRSLLPLVFGGRSGERSFYAMTRGADGPNQAAVPKLMLESNGWRAHYAPLQGTTELYDAVRDPREERDLAPEQPLRALLLRQSLLIQSARNRELLGSKEPDRPDRDLAPERTEQLKALGYLN
jgi:arylsulfatase A-like enzyme